MVCIPACHAGDRSSILRLGGCHFLINFFCFKKLVFYYEKGKAESSLKSSKKTGRRRVVHKSRHIFTSQVILFVCCLPEKKHYYCDSPQFIHSSASKPSQSFKQKVRLSSFRRHPLPTEIENLPRNHLF